jgi:hypothetical protein
MKLILLKEPVEHRGESLVSLFCGAPTLALGVGAVILLTSYLVGRPIGSARFYTIEHVKIEETNKRGKVFVSSREHVFPSAQLLLIISAGICCGSFGIYLTRRRRRCRRATVSTTGIIVCGVAFLMAWSLFVRAALM